MQPSVQLVLATFERHGVQAILMGGQACVYYGASEVTRDVDVAILSDASNLAALSTAMRELQAQVIAVPPFMKELLDAGHAVHFRCAAPAVSGLRVDIMSRMRGVDPFPVLWERRTLLANGVGVLSLPDLVLAKKTQRDKDWPMVRRLIEADYFAPRSSVGDAAPSFWLRECRTPSLLQNLVAHHPIEASRETRPVVQLAVQGATAEAISQALRDEEDAERAIDAAYWRPLKKQLEALRHSR
ncbi:MAG: hypothetical protein SGJ11_04045 [Phycisphaerae bacterium]|nr:hypothetical protein [Phycisphaerae bacterium]